MITGMPPAISGGAIVLRGKKYALDDVLDAYVEVIDALTARFGGERSYAVAHGWDLLSSPVPWPVPGKRDAVAAWRDHAEVIDVLGSAVLHRIGPIEAYAYVLGGECATYDPDTDVLTMADDRVVTDYARARPDSAPFIDLYGLSQHGSFTGMSASLTEKVRAAVLADLAKYGLRFTATQYGHGEGLNIVARIGFPESIYGAGDDWLRVRCTAPDGSELVAAHGGN